MTKRLVSKHGPFLLVLVSFCVWSLTGQRRESVSGFWTAIQLGNVFTPQSLGLSPGFSPRGGGFLPVLVSEVVRSLPGGPQERHGDMWCKGPVTCDPPLSCLNKGPGGRGRTPGAWWAGSRLRTALKCCSSWGGGVSPSPLRTQPVRLRKSPPPVPACSVF